VAIAPDGSWLATAGSDGTVRIWDPNTAGNRQILDFGDTSDIVQLAVCFDGTKLAAVNREGTIQAWNLTTEAPRPDISLDTEGPPQVLTWLPGTTTLAAGNTDAIYVFHLCYIAPSADIHTVSRRHLVSSRYARNQIEGDRAAKEGEEDEFW
jgi:WD40 repeat protein